MMTGFRLPNDWIVLAVHIQELKIFTRTIIYSLHVVTGSITISKQYSLKNFSLLYDSCAHMTFCCEDLEFDVEFNRGLLDE